jgi:hypothetical protein
VDSLSTKPPDPPGLLWYALYVIELPTPDLGKFQPSARHFGCFLVMDASRVSDNAIRALARGLLSAGAAYFSAWGLQCRRVHDLIDEERPAEEPGPDDVVMTTWHNDEPLDEAIWQSIFVDFRTGRYEEACDAIVAVVVNDPAAANQIRRRYSDLERLCRDVEDAD